MFDGRRGVPDAAPLGALRVYEIADGYRDAGPTYRWKRRNAVWHWWNGHQGSEPMVTGFESHLRRSPTTNPAAVRPEAGMAPVRKVRKDSNWPPSDSSKPANWVSMRFQ
jgi:hypothetical protein